MMEGSLHRPLVGVYDRQLRMPMKLELHRDLSCDRDSTSNLGSNLRSEWGCTDRETERNRMNWPKWRSKGVAKTKFQTWIIWVCTPSFSSLGCNVFWDAVLAHVFSLLGLMKWCITLMNNQAIKHLFTFAITYVSIVY